MFMLLLFPTHNSTIAQTAQKTQAQTIAGVDKPPRMWYNIDVNYYEYMRLAPSV
jgi:hypothetical protein